MNSFAVIEVTTDGWSGTKTKKIVMQSDSELLCYRQALVLQKTTYNCPGDRAEVNYEVSEVSYK